MYVIKRDGERQPVHFDKITARIDALCKMAPPLTSVDPMEVAQKVIQGMHSGISTHDLDLLASKTLAYRIIDHPDYGTLAARIEVSNLQKSTPGDILEVTMLLREACLVREDHAGFVAAHVEELRAMMDYDRDFRFDYFGIKTIQRSYLMNLGARIVERPQDLWMRVALEVVGYADSEENLAAIRDTYDLLSLGFYTHATPTLYSAGTRFSQMSSCFLLTMQEDSIAGIYETLKQCALISKHAGGIGLAISGVRATDSYIQGTNGRSNGIVPMLRVFNDTARYVDQGGGKRKGSFAMYLEPWHADVEEFLELKKNHGKEEARARDLFYALWVPDLFMKRVESKGTWSLFCPHECPGLADTYGEEFEALYTRYESEGRARKQLPAIKLWAQILTAQVETGTPYMLFKDHVNRKSQQQNIGIIRSSNLCAEIVEHTSPEEIAVCNLASINLARFVIQKDAGDEGEEIPILSRYDMAGLRRVVKVAVRNLNSVIDRNYYPLPQTSRSNLRNRPIGLGVQGLADAFAMLGISFDSAEAAALNTAIAENMYFAALEASCDLAAQHGPYETFADSPASRGKLQLDLWREAGHWDPASAPLTLPEGEWQALRERVQRIGLRNSLLVALMPTASTSQILGNNECFEPYTSNLYSRRTLAGEFVVANRHLQRDLIRRGLWNRALIEQLMADGGSVQNLPIPEDLKRVYRTVWEIPQKVCVDLALARGPFVDQTQSFNVFIASPTASKMSSLHFYSWRRGAKTGMYYLRTKPSAQPIQFTLGSAGGSAAAAVSAAVSAAGEESGVCESCSA
jgi:ribonucleoside-diphosphate reductase alpha chain